MVGCCTLMYQTLDNMDGKQARRTGSSSPLGLLFDHGIDALNIVLGAFNSMAMLQVGHSREMCALIWLAGVVPFFFATWEEYHTGYLYLGFFNGPTDGVLILAASQFLSACVDDYTVFWTREAFLNLSRKEVVVVFYLVCVLFTVLGNLVAVARVSRGWARLRAALGLAVPFCLSLTLGAAWLAMSGSGAFARSPRLVFWLLGLPFLKMVIHLQLAHVCAESYRPWMVSLLPPVVILAGAGIVPASIFEEGALLLPSACVAWLAGACLHLAWFAVRDVAHALNICVFRIPVQAAKQET